MEMENFFESHPPTLNTTDGQYIWNGTEYQFYPRAFDSTTYKYPYLPDLIEYQPDPDILEQFKLLNPLTEKEDNKMTTNRTNHYCFPAIEKVIVNGPATIVYFDDNDRVIVKRMDIDKDDLFSAVAQAYCKKAFGSTSAFHREVLDKLVVQDPKKKNTKNTSVSPEITKQIDDGIRSVVKGINSAFRQISDNFKSNI